MAGWKTIFFLLGSQTLFSGATCHVSFREGVGKTSAPQMNYCKKVTLQSQRATKKGKKLQVLRDYPCWFAREYKTTLSLVQIFFLLEWIHPGKKTRCISTFWLPYMSQRFQVNHRLVSLGWLSRQHIDSFMVHFPSCHVSWSWTLYTQPWKMNLEPQKESFKRLKHDFPFANGWHFC